MNRAESRSVGLASIRESARDVPVSGSFDVVVAGGGIAGVAAAVAAARNGASVCLLERLFGLGGLATLGNVIVWLPLCDGRGRQVMAGLPEELLRLSVADLKRDNRAARFLGVPACWEPGGDPDERKKVRFRVDFNPSSYLLALEDLVVSAGVTLLYDTRVTAVRQEADLIRHVIVENKSGRNALACRTVVDATGDADVCFLAGEQTESLDSNVLAGWFYYLRPDGPHLKTLSNRYSPLAEKEGAAGPFFRGDDAAQVTGHLLGTRALMRRVLADLRAQHPAEDIQVFAPPTLPCFRMTRRLVGAFSLADRNRHEWFDDAIGLTGDWRRRGPVYAVPWRALAGVRNRNLAAVGRCMSADTTVWDVMRAIPGCALTGTAAGTAAALAARQTGGDLQALSIVDLQARLREQGALLDPALAREAPAVDGVAADSE
jgi:hypothetical protein